MCINTAAVLCDVYSVIYHVASRSQYHRRETLMPCSRRRGDLSAVEQFCSCGYNFIRMVIEYDDNGAKDSATASSPAIAHKYLYIYIYCCTIII